MCKPAFIDSRAASCSRLVEPSDGSESISVSISLIFRVIIVLNRDDKTFSIRNYNRISTLVNCISN